MSKEPDVVSTAARILEDHEICDSCLGRLFGELSHGLTNRERGKSLRTVAGMVMDKPIVEDDSCNICFGLCSDLDSWVERTIETVEGYEFSTFLFGTRLRRVVKRNQESLEEKYNLKNAEDFSHAVNRALGKRFRDNLAERGITVEADFDTPDLTVLLDFENDRIEIELRPVYVYGRYRKLTRGIPQTDWPEMGYSNSVEEIISSPARSLSRSESSVFHGGGREDVDVLCLGGGRPFVVELREPRIRSLDLNDLKEETKKSEDLEIRNLRIVAKGAVEAIKSAKPDKIYRALVDSEVEIGADDFAEGLRKIQGRIFQRTPTRVAHRRSDLVRVRRVFGASGRRAGDRNYEVYLWAESGLYIKELITSEGHRSLPSLSGNLGCDLTVGELDVADVPGKLESVEGGSYRFAQDRQTVKDIFAGNY